jgi:hypothetical protein
MKKLIIPWTPAPAITAASASRVRADGASASRVRVVTLSAVLPHLLTTQVDQDM